MAGKTMKLEDIEVEKKMLQEDLDGVVVNMIIEFEKRTGLKVHDYSLYLIERGEGTRDIRGSLDLGIHL